MQYLSDLTGETPDMVMAKIEMTLVGELDDVIQDDLVAYFEYGTERGVFASPPSRDVFFDEWR